MDETDAVLGVPLKKVGMRPLVEHDILSSECASSQNLVAHALSVPETFAAKA